MAKTPKHLQQTEAETVERLKTGFSRFRFGFADVGETFDSPHGLRLTFLGDFGRLKDAIECERKQMLTGCDTTNLHPYLNGKRKIGWTVWYAVRISQSTQGAA